MKFVINVLVLCQALSVVFTVTTTWTFEFEDFALGNPSVQTRWRSNASNNKTLYVTKDIGVATFNLCVFKTGASDVKLNVSDIVYSNDGPTDSITLTYNGELLDTFMTEEVHDWGNRWNMFQHTGPAGDVINVTYQHGTHELVIDIYPTEYGVELDKLVIIAENQHPQRHLFCDQTFRENYFSEFL